MVFIKIKQNYFELQNYLNERGILFPKQPNKTGFIRCVTHLDITKEDIDEIIKTIKSFF